MDLTTYIESVASGAVAFKDIPMKARQAIIAQERLEGTSVKAVSDKYHVPVSTVYYLSHRWEERLGKYLQKFAHQAIGRLFARAEFLYSKAVDRNDFDLAWKIETGFIDRLMKMGLVKEEPQKHLVGRLDQTEDEMRKSLAHDVGLLGRVLKLNGTSGGKTDSGDAEGGNGEGGGNG